MLHREYINRKKENVIFISEISHLNYTKFAAEGMGLYMPYKQITSANPEIRASKILGLLQKAALWPIALWLYDLVALDLGDHENVME